MMNQMRRRVLFRGVLADSVSLQCQSTIAIPTWTCEKLKILDIEY